MTQKTILVTGGNGQLAASIRELAPSYTSFKFIFRESDSLDITDSNLVNTFFLQNRIDWVINCAAYTAVDKAETESDLAYNVNKKGAENLAKGCPDNIKFIHISTDFVFDGQKDTPYNEEDSTNPIGVYGHSKLEGEIAVTSSLEKYYIIRTAWLYSEFGSNFLKTMMRLAETKSEINVVKDQIGSPTYALDLAKALMKIITEDNNKFGIYHYSNEGEISWYDFAKTIFDITKSTIKVNPIPSSEYPTPAKRPKYSVLDKNKIKDAFDAEVPNWKDSLKKAISKL